MTHADHVDKIQLTLCVFAALCIVALLAVDVYMKVG
jgi:hypothetical protein